MMKFKNLRRPNKSITFDKENEPPPKRRRRNERLWYSPSPEDDADMMYDDAVSNLQKEWAKTKPKKKHVRRFFNATMKQRQNWIRDDCPSVKEIVEKFLKETALGK